MQPKKGLELRQIGNRYVIVKVCDDLVNMTDVFTLNRTAARLWQRMAEGGFTAGQLARWLCDTYDVAPDRAQADVKRQLDEWKNYGLLEEKD